MEQIIEEWRPIAEFDGEYEVSNLGRVRSMKKYRGQTGRIMPQTQQHHGYHAVMCWHNNKAYCRKVHRLVAEAFIPNPNHLGEVNHIDGDHDNNQVSNLEWVTHQANVQHSFDTGIKVPHRWTDEERQHISAKVKETLKNKRK